MKENLRVSEMFYSIQGEGPTMGKPAIFLRLQGCNLNCTWCDTVEVWRKGSVMTFEEIYNTWVSSDWYPKCKRIVVTGGEPLMQQKQLVNFFDYLLLKEADLTIEIETNGTLMPSNELLKHTDQINCSPKLRNSLMSGEMRFNEAVLEKLKGISKACFKFVVESHEDVLEAERNIIYRFKIPKDRIYLMPQTIDNEMDVRQRVAEFCKKNGYNYSERLQCVIWGKTTGV